LNQTGGGKKGYSKIETRRGEKIYLKKKKRGGRGKIGLWKKTKGRIEPAQTKKRSGLLGGLGVLHGEGVKKKEKGTSRGDEREHFRKAEGKI